MRQECMCSLPSLRSALQRLRVIGVPVLVAFWGPEPVLVAFGGCDGADCLAPRGPVVGAGYHQGSHCYFNIIIVDLRYQNADLGFQMPYIFQFCSISYFHAPGLNVLPGLIFLISKDVTESTCVAWRRSKASSRSCSIKR